MKEKILKCINEVCGRELCVADISENDFLTELELDSMSIINLVVLIEQEFGIEFSDEDILSDALRSFAGLCSLVEGLIGDKNV